jgi:anti-anti-sigma regulatory factor
VAHAIEQIGMASEAVLNSMGLLLTSHKCGRCLMVNVWGNVGADGAELLHTRLRAVLNGYFVLVAVNLVGAILTDDSALEMLIGINRHAILAGKVLLVIAPDPRALKTMRATGLDRSLLVFPTVADFNAWNGDPGGQPDDGGVVIGGWADKAHRNVSGRG